MSNLPALIILVISFGGMIFMIVRKWPELLAIEVLSQGVIEKKSFKQRMREGITGMKPMGDFSTEKFLKKLLMKTKILFMKGERRADGYLRRVSHSEKFKDDYWEKINKN